MVVVRNVFRLKFGKAREAVALMKESIAIQKRLGVDAPHRLLTDVTGPFYTIVLELTLPNVAAMETSFSRVSGDKEWHAVYEKMTLLVDSGYREIFHLVD